MHICIRDRGSGSIDDLGQRLSECHVVGVFGASAQGMAQSVDGRVARESELLEGAKK